MKSLIHSLQFLFGLVWLIILALLIAGQDVTTRAEWEIDN